MADGPNPLLVRAPFTGVNRTTDRYGITPAEADEYRLTATLNDVPSNAYVLGGDETTLVIDSGTPRY